jgi:UDP-N-acetylmuramoyl-tripeptide--D-alanyl-D-alanine ligase
VTALVSAVILSASMVADATGGRVLSGPPDRVFASVSIDSRTVPPDALFVALRGGRFDGHAFVAEAAARGAAGVLVADPVAPRPDVSVIVVGDTLEALQRLGHQVRRQSGVRLVAITGSAGKTTTKEVTADLLADRYRVFRNSGNFNNHVGLPLSLTGLAAGFDVAVVEFGMNHPGEIRALVGIAEPDVRVWTNVGDAHIGFFGSRDAIADAKGEILEAASRGALLVANADDALVMDRVERWRGRLLTFGERRGADVRAARVADHGFDGTTADLDTPAGPLAVSVPLPGRAQLSNALAAVTVATEFGVELDTIAQRLAGLRAVARRGAVTRLANGARIVDDSYNASPAAVQAMLAALAATATTGRRLAVLGEMLELGDSARRLHETCGRAAAAAGLSDLFVVGGPAVDGLVDGALSAGMARDHVHRYADSAAAVDHVASVLAADDVLLVKGSRGARTDVIVDRVVAMVGVAA